MRLSGKLTLGVLAIAPLALVMVPRADAAPIISEFMAANVSTLADQDGEYADWVEIYNPDPVSDSLGGWYLTNKAGSPAKWQIPAVTLRSGRYLVIFCSSKNYTNPSEPLATSFNLSSSGGYVALVEPDGQTVASSYTYPIQYPDVSYGVTQPANPGEAPQIGYFATATPGAANGNYTNILLADQVSPSAPPGLFTGSTTVGLSGATGAEHIRYILTPPSSTGDAVPAPTAAWSLYTGPIVIGSTGLVQAAVFSADDSQHGFPTTAMYTQLDNSSANRLDTFSSNLPLVVFDDNGFGLLPNNHLFYPAWIGAFSVGSNATATLTQVPDFFTPDTMKLHGFSSANWPKQSYESALTNDQGSDLDVSFFGLDADKSWDNISCWDIDRTYIHNAMVYSLYSSMGYWAPRIKYSEMFIHAFGGPLDATSYSGITAITDRIKVGANRVNIYSLSPADVTAPNVTGGYILRIDHPEPTPAAGAYTYYSWATTEGTTLMVDTPKLDVLTIPQIDYITGYVQQMEDAMVADQASGYATHNYLNFLDRTSWVDYHLLNVFVENDDAFLYSEYFNKDVNGLIKAGPVWDYDRSLCSADGRDDNPLQWTPTNDGNYWNDGWWTYVTHDPDFMQAWIDRWQSLRLSLLSNNNLVSLVNHTAAQVGPAAAARDAARWPTNQSRFLGGWAGEIGNMSSWLGQRAQWIDQQFVAAPIVNVSDVGVVLMPPTGAQIAYTLDGSDPRLPGGGVSPLAALINAPVTLAAGQIFMARSYNASQVGAYPGSPWSSPVNAASTSANTTGQLVNVSSRTQVGTGANILIEGFSVTGPATSTQQVLIRAIGPGLTQLKVTGVLAQPVLSIYDSKGNLIATNTGWSNNDNVAAIQAAVGTVGAFPLPIGSADSALLLPLSPGNYTMQVSGLGGTTGIALGEVYQVNQADCQVVNISGRAQVGISGGILIAGFGVAGGPARMLIRGDGPSLIPLGVPNCLLKPVVQVFDSNGDIIASNTGWSGGANVAPMIANATAMVGAFTLPIGSADSALLLTLPPGNYTMQISGLGGTVGDALAECYLMPSN